jgi:BolA protein
MNTRERLESLLTAALAPTELELEDESHLHRGHAGAADGGGHFRLRIVSSQFAGLNMVARHRLVYSTVSEEMKNAVHALAMSTLTPEEAGAASTT